MLCVTWTVDLSDCTIEVRYRMGTWVLLFYLCQAVRSAVPRSQFYCSLIVPIFCRTYMSISLFQVVQVWPPQLPYDHMPSFHRLHMHLHLWVYKEGLSCRLLLSSFQILRSEYASYAYLYLFYLPLYQSTLLVSITGTYLPNISSFQILRIDTSCVYYSV